MIIKLARILDNEHEAALTGETKKEYRSIKAGAVLGGTVLGTKYLSKVTKEINPKLNPVKRFLLKQNILIPGLGDTVSKRVFDPGTGLRMGAIGALGGAIAGVGIHKAIHAYQKRKQ